MWQYNYTHPSELYHHGILGQKWGVRHWQYYDGTYTPAGRARYGWGDGKPYSGVHEGAIGRLKRTRLYRSIDEKLGINSVDSELRRDTRLHRIQSNKNFEKHAFYATYKNRDVDKYEGLFGKNLKDRANAMAKQAERRAFWNPNAANKMEASRLRTTADNMNIYKLDIGLKKNIRVASDDNAGDIVNGLTRKDREFRKNLISAIVDSKAVMRRPQQQVLFNDALKILRKDPAGLTSKEKKKVYRALNLTLTNHNETQVKMQDTFYKEMKKKGYGAIVDINDQKYSSYHAKRPMIVFDTSSAYLSSVTKLDSESIEAKYKKYNRERIAKEALNVHKLLGAFGQQTVQEIDQAANDYLYDTITK